MEQPTTPPSSSPSTDPTGGDQDRAFAALAASIERLEELGLHDERGRVVVEPAMTFRPA
jgi:hypothetical protein